MTEEQKKQIDDLRAQDPRPTLKQICKTVGCSDGQLNRHLYMGGNALPKADEPETFEDVREDREHRDQVQYLKAQVRDAAREETAVQRIIAAIEKYSSPAPPPPLTKFKSPSKAASKETMLIDFCDWHYGEIVDLERMRGLNEYNSAIAERRVAHIVATIRDIKCRLEAGRWAFEDAVIVLGGDMVSGTIHDLERNSDDTIVCTTLNCAELLFKALQDLSTVFPHLTVCGVVGNHGRLPDAKKKQYKDPERNWDYLIYQAVAWKMSEFKNVAFVFPRAHSMVVNVRDHNIFICHGDEYRAQFSLPYYGIERQTRGIQAIEASRGQSIDYSLIHHWHSLASTPLAGGRRNIIMPSLKGGDEFSLEKLGVCGHAGQWMCGMKEDVGLTMEWPIYCQ